MKLILKITTLICILQLSAFSATACDSFLDCHSASVEKEKNDDPHMHCHNQNDSESEENESKDQQNNGCKCCIIFSTADLKVKPNALMVVSQKAIEYFYRSTTPNQFHSTLFRPPIS